MNAALAQAVDEWSEDLIDELTPEEAREMEELMEDRYGPIGLCEFIAENFPHEPPPEHLGAIARLIERANNERVMVCLSLPPRHGKTVTILRGIVWWLLNNPADTCAYATYSDDQALSKSKLCRKWARQCGLELDPEVENASEWRTPQGGGLIAGGLRAGFTGQGVAGLFIVDDPFKNRREADSPVIRQGVWDEFNDVVFTRLEGASVIVVHTRWHEDDLIGRLISQEENPWEYLNIKAISELDKDGNNTDPLGREPGTALWDGKFNMRELVRIRKQIRERSFASLYQGRPSPAEGNIIKREWIKYYDVLPTGLTDQQQSWDLTFKGKNERKKKSGEGSYVVGQVWGRKGPDIYLIDQFRGQPDFPSAIRQIKAMTAKHPKALRKLIEDAANGPATIATLRKEIPGIVAVSTKGQSKEERLHNCSPLFEGGNIYLPRWAEGVVEELVSFPNAVNDDQVDALSMSLNNYLASVFTEMNLDLSFGLKTENWRY